MDKFVEWFELKRSLDRRSFRLPFVKLREVWWCALGKNIGHELNGKSAKFSRPVLIVRKLSRKSFYVLPLTTKLKNGSWYYNLEFRSKRMCACLNQLRMIDYRRLYERIGRIEQTVFVEIKSKLQNLLK